MRSFNWLRAREIVRLTAWKSAACRSAITLPEPDSTPLQPSTSELKSHELCVVSTLTGRARLWSSRICRSC